MEEERRLYTEKLSVLLARQGGQTGQIRYDKVMELHNHGSTQMEKLRELEYIENLLPPVH